jgi:Na+/phosphate symporter
MFWKELKTLRAERVEGLRLADQLRRQNADVVRELMAERTKRHVADEEKRKAEKELRALHELVGKRGRDVKVFLEQLSRMNLTTDEVTFALAGIADDSMEYLAVMKLISRQYEVELDMALRPNLTNEDRQYGAGRGAAVADILNLIESGRREGAERLKQANKTSD